jgi:hypothetical protein
MLRVDFGGAGKGGQWLTINLDGEGKGHPVPDIVADITAAANQLGAYLQPGSIDEARCIATLEHIIPWNVIDTLKYWRSFMKPDAVLTISVPDLRGIIADYLAEEYGTDTLAAILYGPKDWQWKTPYENHRWGWDESSLLADLYIAGYHDMRRIDEMPPGFVVDGHHVADLTMEAHA